MNQASNIESIKKDLTEIFDEEWEKRKLITPAFAAEKLAEKGYCKRQKGRWKFKGTAYGCSLCDYGVIAPVYNFCPDCGSEMEV